MTLTNRLTMFFLGMVALILLGFSVTLYLLAKKHLVSQVDERLDAAMNTLVAAIEVGPDFVEWEPATRTVSTGSPSLGDDVTWVVTDASGRVVARSPKTDSEELLREAVQRLSDAAQTSKRIHWQGERWQAGQRWIVPDRNLKAEKPIFDESHEARYSSLVITTACPFAPMQSTLRKLAHSLVTVTLCVLMICITAGKLVCRRALQPLRQVASSARIIKSLDRIARLDVPPANDEISDLTRSFNDLLDRLQVTFDRQSQFTSDASHQLRTPLAAILGQIEVSQRRPRSADELQTVLSTIHTKAEHLKRIIESLLCLARTNVSASTNSLIDMTQWMKSHLETWKDHERFSDFRAELPDKRVSVSANPVLLGELTNILLDNACHYSQPGTLIEIRLLTEGGSTRLDIIDRGQGIGADDLPNIYTPFFRSVEALHANKDGIGLGLSLAARLATAMNATLRSESEKNQGSRFSVIFPL